MPPPPVADTVASAIARSPLTLKSWSRLPDPMSSDLLGRLTRGSETVLSGAPDDENLDLVNVSKQA